MAGLLCLGCYGWPFMAGHLSLGIYGWAFKEHLRVGF